MQDSPTVKRIIYSGGAVLNNINRVPQKYIVWTLALFFGWLLAFPFFGPLLLEPANINEGNAPSLYLIFILSQSLTFLLGGIFLKKVIPWKKMMFWSLIPIILLNILLWFSKPELWPAGVALLGVLASIYILGWSYPYAEKVAEENRLKLMALTIIISNIIYLGLNALSLVLDPQLLIIPLLSPLMLSLLILLRFPESSDSAHQPAVQIQPTSSLFTILIVAIFIFGLYLNSGLMYNVVYSTLDSSGLTPLFFRYIPYKLVLVLILTFRRKVQWNFSIFMGVSLLGIAFVSFAILQHEITRYYITETLMQAAFALLDLFCWVLLGSIAALHRYPTRIFGFGLAAMLASIAAGESIGGKLLLVGENYPLMTALFAACAIFLTFLIIPWLHNRVIQELHNENPGEKNELIDRVRAIYPKGFTPREEEIIHLLLEGLSNREIAGKLFMSENTLKTHLKHIYQKVGVTHKREFISMALREQDF